KNKRFYKFQLYFIEEAESLLQNLKQIKSFLNKPDIFKTLLLNNKIKFYPDKNLIKRRQIIINILNQLFIELEAYETSIFDNENNIKNYEKVLKFTDDKEEIISQINNLKELNKSLSQKVEVNKQYIDKFNKELVQIHEKILNVVSDKYIIKLMNEIDNRININNYKYIKPKIDIKFNKKINKLKNNIRYYTKKYSKDHFKVKKLKLDLDNEIIKYNKLNELYNKLNELYENNYKSDQEIKKFLINIKI